MRTITISATQNNGWHFTQGRAKCRWKQTIALILFATACAVSSAAMANSPVKSQSRYYKVDFEPGTAIPTSEGRAMAEEARLMQININMDRFEIWGHGDVGQSPKAARKLADKRMTVIARMLTRGNNEATPVVMHGEDGTIPIDRIADLDGPSDGTVEVYCGQGPSDQTSGKLPQQAEGISAIRSSRHKPSH